MAIRLRHTMVRLSWNLLHGEPTRVFVKAGSDFMPVALSRDGLTVAATGYGVGTFIYNVKSGRQLYRVPDSWGIAFSPDAKTMVTNMLHGVAVFPTKVRMETCSVGPQWTPFRNESNGNEPLVSTVDAVFDTADGSKRFSIGGVISSDQRSLYRAMPDGTLHVHDLTTGSELRQITLRLPERKLLHTLIAPDKRLAAAHDDAGGIQIVDLDTGKAVQRIEGVKAAILCMQFSAANEILAAGCVDGQVRFWDVRTGRNAGSFQAHPASGPDGGVAAMAFSDDGKYLATGGTRIERTIRICAGPYMNRYGCSPVSGQESCPWLSVTIATDWFGQSGWHDKALGSCPGTRNPADGCDVRPAERRLCKRRLDDRIFRRGMGLRQSAIMGRTTRVGSARTADQFVALASPVRPTRSARRRFIPSCGSAEVLVWERPSDCRRTGCQLRSTGKVHSYARLRYDRHASARRLRQDHVGF